MSETRDIFTIDELRSIGYQCNCGTEINVDVSKASLNSMNPPACPSCGEKLTKFSECVNLYKTFWQMAHTSAIRLRS